MKEVSTCTSTCILNISGARNIGNFFDLMTTRINQLGLLPLNQMLSMAVKHRDWYLERKSD